MNNSRFRRKLTSAVSMGMMFSLAFMLMLFSPVTVALWPADVITAACDQHHTRLVSVHGCFSRGRLMQVAKYLSSQNIQQAWNIDIAHMSEENFALFVVDLDCPDSETLMIQASINRQFTLRNKWLLLSSSLSNVSGTVGDSDIQDLYPWLADLTIFPDSSVTLSIVGHSEPLSLYRTGKESHVSIAKGKDRSDLQGTKLKASTVLFSLEKFKGFYSEYMREVDTWPKLHYPIVVNLAGQLNFNLELWAVNDYGWDVSENGSFAGIMGQLQRRDIDFAATGFFMRSDRMLVVDFTAETYHIRTTILFRQPSLSSVSNIFLLPFSKEVWICLTAYCVIVITIFTLEIVLVKKCGGVLCATMKNVSPLDIISIVLGAVCQQGSHLQPKKLSARLTLIFLSLTALFFFTSYSANIVALLQSPSSALNTVSDLVKSPLAVGIQDKQYNRVYFEESNDSQTKLLYESKVKPLGVKAYFSPVEGIQRVRTDLFAFNVETDLGYKMISETFLETEKCGLNEIQLFPMPILSIPLTKRSGYRDLFTQKVRWQRETGILHRHGTVWLPQRPRCEDPRGGTGYVSVGLKEIFPALKVLLYGMSIAISFLIVENLYFHRKKLKLLSAINICSKENPVPETDIPDEVWAFYVSDYLIKNNQKEMQAVSCVS